MVQEGMGWQDRGLFCQNVLDVKYGFTSHKLCDLLACKSYFSSLQNELEIILKFGNR